MDVTHATTRGPLPERTSPQAYTEASKTEPNKADFKGVTQDSN